MKRKTVSFLAALLLLLTLVIVNAQKQDKPWTDWSKKEAEKVLEDSPWAQTQTDTDTTEMFFTPGKGGVDTGVNSAGNRDFHGATNQSVGVTFHVRFFSARPVRMALVRTMELQQSPTPEMAEKLRNFAELKSSNSIIVTVTFDSSDQRYQREVMQAFNSATTGTLKNTTYLERGDGKRLFLEEYVPPGRDGFGARFIFLREMDGQPFITANIAQVRFHTQYPDGIKVDRPFKVADMMFDGKLEY